MLLCVIQFDYIHKYRKKERKKEREREKERKRKKEYMSRNIYFLGMLSGKFKTCLIKSQFLLSKLSLFVCVRGGWGGGYENNYYWLLLFLNCAFQITDFL